MKLQPARVLCATLALATISFASDLRTNRFKLVPADAQISDQFGVSIAIDGTTLVVGADSVDGGGLNNNAGAAYVFVFDGTQWVEQAKLKASDAGADDWFGRAVAIQGDTIVVGAPGCDTFDLDHGAVYVFVRSGSTWSQQAKIFPPDFMQYLGASVAISNETLLAGAPGSRDAFVYVRRGTNWSQQTELATLDATPAEFGCSVAVLGQRALIGARGDSDLGSGAGAAYVFERAAGVWSQTQKLYAGSPATSDSFGWSVALGADTLVIGAPRATLSQGTLPGAAYVFTPAGGSWTQAARLQSSDAWPNDNFGYAVSIDAGNLLIGAPERVEAGLAFGSAYVFAGAGASWTELHKLLSGDGSQPFPGHFGGAVACRSGSFFVGAFQGGGPGVPGGVAYTYDPPVAAGELYCSGNGGAVACPCANTGWVFRGCANGYTDHGALLFAAGEARVSNDTLQLIVYGEWHTSNSLLLQGTLPANGGTGHVFGDGIACVGGTSKRLSVQQAYVGMATFPGSGQAPISVQGLIPPQGGVRYYQVIYRDPLNFCTSSEFNYTNGCMVTWLP